MSGEKISKEVLEKAPDAVQEAVGGLMQEVAPTEQAYIDTISKKAHDFIENNYTAEQRQEIYNSLQKDENGDVYWRDGKDFVKLSLDEQGRLRKGVMRDEYDDGSYKELKFGANDTTLRYNSRELQEGNVIKQKVKVKTKDDATVIKKRSSNSSTGIDGGSKEVEKTRVVVGSEGHVTDASFSSSTTVGNVFGGNFQYGKETVRVSYSSDGKPLYVSDQTKNIGVSVFEGKAGTSTRSAKAVYDDDGNIDTVSTKSSELYVDKAKIGGSYGTSSTTYQADGSEHHVEKGFSAEYAMIGSVKIGVHSATADKTVTMAGTDVSSTSKDVGLAFGSGGTGVHYAMERSSTDALGNQVTEGKNIDMAYSLADRKIEMGYARHNKKVQDGMTQAYESKKGLSAGDGKIGVTAFTSNTTIDVDGTVDTTKKGLMAGIDTRAKSATYASYTSNGEKSYNAQLQTDGGMGLTAGRTVTKIDENGAKTTENKEAKFGLLQDGDGTKRVMAMRSNSSIDVNGQENATKKGFELGVNANAIGVTQYNNNQTKTHQASFNTDGELSASLSRTTTTAENGTEQVTKTELNGGFSKDDQGHLSASALKTKTAVDENGKGKVRKYGLETTLDSKNLTAEAGRYGQNSSNTYQANINQENGLSASAFNTTVKYTENGDVNSTTGVQAGVHNEGGNLSAMALKTKTVRNGEDESVTKRGVEGLVSTENLSAEAGRYGQNSSNVYQAKVKDENGFGASASTTMVKHTENGDVNSTTGVQAGVHNEGGNLSAMALKTKTVRNGEEESITKRGVEGSLNTENLTTEAGQYGKNSSNTYQANLSDLGSNVVQGVAEGKNVAAIYNEVKAGFKVETKLTRDVRKDAEAVGVDTSGVAEAEQKFNEAVDARDVAAKEKDKENTKIAVATSIRQNSNANG